MTEAPIRKAEYRKKHGIGSTLMAAICRGMGLPRRSRFLTESQVNKWRRDHPEFRAADVYLKKPAPAAAADEHRYSQMTETKV